MADVPGQVARKFIEHLARRVPSLSSAPVLNTSSNPDNGNGNGHGNDVGDELGQGNRPSEASTAPGGGGRAVTARPTAELDRWSGSLADMAHLVLAGKSPEQKKIVISEFIRELQAQGDAVPDVTTTPYFNTIPVDEQPDYPGDLEMERLIRAHVRWNAMAMVVKANKSTNVGGHIATFASLATLYEVGFNHFFRGGADGTPQDLIYYQGHASPGNYARAYMEYRLSDEHLTNFRQELRAHPGLSSYPHPYLMPDFWLFPTVSMGLGPINSIYQARFSRYLQARSLTKTDPFVWAFIGDGESDEPETHGAIGVAGREGLDNLVWVINCNLQRLDGPVRGNGKVIQDLEGQFRGAGWNVIKVIWGSNWDALLAKDKSGLLIRRMDEVVDGEYQKYVVETGAYIRKHFFGKYPELLRLVDHLTDEQLQRLTRGGHDPKKVYAAYVRATARNGRPTVILAKTVKGYGMGDAGEGRNPSHQQKKLQERNLREFRQRFSIPLDDDVIADLPFYRPAKDSAEVKYLFARREALNGFNPVRKDPKIRLETPPYTAFRFLIQPMTDGSTTKAYTVLLSQLLRDPNIGRYVVPIVPDEARTFGMEGLFKQVGIYSSKGQRYDPVDQSDMMPYIEKVDGQLVEEGIN